MRAIKYLQRLWAALFGKAERVTRLRRKMAEAMGYDEWADAARALDSLEGGDRWKADPRSADYDWELVQTRLREMQRARLILERRKGEDPMSDEGHRQVLSFLLRSTLSRNMADLGSPRLYANAHCRYGTKLLIEQFTSEAVGLLEALAARAMSMSLDRAVSCEAKGALEVYRELRHAYGNTALLLSGGGALGTHHIGVMKALHEQELLPRIISGSSSGALMAAMACTRPEAEFRRLLRLEGVNVGFLEEPLAVGQSWLPPKVARFLSQGVLFDSDHLLSVMRENLGDLTFLEAYQVSRRVLNITVSSATVYEVPRLLNYLTAPNVFVWSAVGASCTIPGLFAARPILAKDPRTGQPTPWRMSGGDGEASRWIDGSVENDLPVRRLSEMFNVNHCIVSQVNPHVYPFLQSTVPEGHSPALRVLRVLLGKSIGLLGSEVRFRLGQVPAGSIY